MIYLREYVNSSARCRKSMTRGHVKTLNLTSANVDAFFRESKTKGGRQKPSARGSTRAMLQDQQPLTRLHLNREFRAYIAIPDRVELPIDRPPLTRDASESNARPLGVLGGLHRVLAAGWAHGTF